VSQQVVSVGLLTSYIRELFEGDGLLGDVWVEGEVSDLFVARSGHVYLVLRDDTSVLKCVLFRAQAQRLPTVPTLGDHVAAHGRVTVYERDGAYQLYVDLIQPAGMGIFALQLELLRQQLALEGLFEPSRKRPIPRFPRCIGVVTSSEGAVWHDIQHVVRRRFPLANLVLAPCAVQGDGAPAQIVTALEALQRDGRPDVIILARGGGSAEDLRCFNDERVVRAVFACRIPVVAGVGHETDRTLVDDVADLRAPTPSAAAELCTPSMVELTARIVELGDALDRQSVQFVGDRIDRFQRLRLQLDRHQPSAVLAARGSRIAFLGERVRRHKGSILSARSVVTDCRLKIANLTRATIDVRRRAVDLDVARLSALAPSSVLNRGYAMLTGDDGRLIGRTAAVATRDAVAARVADGLLALRVEGIVRQPLPSPGDRSDGR
jgi:exodeoxyribonuclease VII large subunit